MFDTQPTSTTPPVPQASIADVERETGIGKDTLRVWEKRYGFPTPDRDVHGERRYGPDQVDRLKHIKRGLDAGLRPGQLVALPLPDLLCALSQYAGRTDSDASNLWEPLWAAITAADNDQLRTRMQRTQTDLGWPVFLQQVVAPLNERVGQAWLAGEIDIHHEHLYAEALQTHLREGMAQLRRQHPSRPPRVLMATLTDEHHGLGLLMAELMLGLAHCDTVSLGTRLPMENVLSAVASQAPQAVALSFSRHYGHKTALHDVQRLRDALPPEVELWAGGAALDGKRLPSLPGVRFLRRLTDLSDAVSSWRQSSRH